MQYYFSFILLFICNFNSLFADDYIVLSYDNHNINGTLIESKNSNSALAIIISGSGPTDRDGNNLSLKSDYLKMLAEGLIKSEISSYRFDKRGVGKSKGDFKTISEINFNDYVNDVVSIINHFKETKKY